MATIIKPEVFARELKKFDKNLEKLADIALSKVGLDLKGDFQVNTPVDSGTLRRNWHSRRMGTGTGVLAQQVIYNSLPYAAPVEYGSGIGERPWPGVGPKTVAQDGRIWSSQAVGGVMAPIINNDEVIDKMEEAIRTFVFGGL